MATAGLLSSTQRKEWDDFVSRSQESTFYHSFDWTELVSIGAGNVPSYWGLWLDGDLAVVWPCFLTRAFGGNLLNFPYSTNGAPILKDNSDLDSLDEVVKYAVRAGKRQNVLHWSLDVPKQSPFANIAPRLGFECSPSPRCTYNVDTTLDSEVLWNRVGHSAKTAVRKARANGLVVDASNEPADIASFLSLYQSTMQRRQLTHLRDVDSLAPLLQRLGEQGKTKLFVAMDGGTIIAGALLLLHKHKAHGWLGTSTPESWSRRPNELLIWTAIEWCSNCGYHNLELGGTPSDPKHGLNIFKRHLGRKTRGTRPLGTPRQLLEKRVLHRTRRHLSWGQTPRTRTAASV